MKTERTLGGGEQGFVFPWRLPGRALLAPSADLHLSRASAVRRRALMSDCWCGTQASMSSDCYWQCHRGGGGQMIIVHDRSGPDAGDAAASLIGSIFTFFLWVGLAGCCCACCAVRYCMLKASQASEQAGGPQAAPTTWLGRMRSAVRHRANPARPSLPKTAERPAQNHALAVAEAAPPGAGLQGADAARADSVCCGG